MRLLGSIFLLLFLSCVKPPSSFVIDFQYVDMPEQECVELTYTNNLPYAICLTPSQWPTEKGQIHFGGDYLFLIVGEKRYPIVDVNLGYCPNCYITVNPGESIVAKIWYRDFNLPDQAHSQTKELEFYPRAFRCKKR